MILTVQNILSYSVDMFNVYGYENDFLSDLSWLSVGEVSELFWTRT